VLHRLHATRRFDNHLLEFVIRFARKVRGGRDLIIEKLLYCTWVDQVHRHADAANRAARHGADAVFTPGIASAPHRLEGRLQLDEWA
jgi:hypothetical protein